jgi:hypothetical protein
MTEKQWDELRRIYLHTLDLIICGNPNRERESLAELWHLGCKTVVDDFKKFLAENDPRQTSPAPSTDHPDRSAN